MDKNSIEEYKREMMKLYGKSTFSDESNKSIYTPETKPVVKKIDEVSVSENPEQVVNNLTYEQQHPVSEEIPDVNENAPDDTAYAERYPEPDLSELDLNSNQTESLSQGYPKEADMGNSIGYILVNTRTGESSSPVARASVRITAVIDGQREIIAFGETDDSGVSPRFSVPAPDIDYSKTPDPARQPYNLFDISVTADGFFNARSVDVPVFSGITSVQDFAMIPVPLMMKSSDETVTYMNQEPRFPVEN